VPRAPANAPVAPTTRAVPEKETRAPPEPLAHASAPRAASRKEPWRPVSRALPLKVTQLELVKLPVAEPLRVLAPIGLPLPWIVALPEAVLPLTWPEPVPAYVAEKECIRAAPAGPATSRAATAAAMGASPAAGCRSAVTGRA
jgi:hypothetical protein